MESADKYGTADDPDPAVRGIVMRRALIGRLEEAERVTQISAPAGSGKTVLLRSWIAEAGLIDSAACVQVQRQERDPQRFWISVIDALRDTIAGSKLVRPLTAAPDLNGCAVVERLLEDLDPLEDRLWLVIDDLDELRSAGALRQLQLLVQRARPELRFVLAARHDLRLGLHRLRLEGQLTELGADDLRFNLDDARALFDTTGISLSDPALAQLHARTEGWAAGLQLAALSLAGHPDPEQSAAQFSGSERTVAAYLLDEVLERQSEKARRMLLRTSVCERINGELADLLTGDSGSEAMLADLEEAGAFVVALDARRSWFRYHQLFADLLQRELRRTSPGELAALHGAAARWYGEYGSPTEAVRHAQAALDWDLAARLLFDHWLDLVLGGQGGTAHELLTSFPAHVVAADAELTAPDGRRRANPGVAGNRRTVPGPGDPWADVGARGAARPVPGRARRSGIVACPAARRPPRRPGGSAAPAGLCRGPGYGATGTGPGPARAGVDRAGYRGGVDRSRGGGVAFRSGHRPGPPTRPALP